MEEFISLREIEGLYNGWIRSVKRFISDYLEVVNWIVNKQATLEYLKTLQKNFSVSYYRKRACQIRKFLLYLDCDWAKCIKLPREPKQIIKRVTVEDIRNTIRIFQSQSSYERYIALTLLGATSGMRSKVMYQLLPENIDFENRVVYVNHNPDYGQTTKTKKHRVALFNEEAKKALEQYLKVYSKNSRLKHLFSKRQCERKYANNPLQVKDLRKFFSQEWDRRGGQTSIKKFLMGHSTKGNVDLMHYNAQSEEDLKKIYDKVMDGNL